jgi:hypothetical protein
MLHFDPTTPDGRLLLSVDFSNLAPVGANIDSVVVRIEVHESSRVDDNNSSLRLDGPPVVTGKIVSQWFKHGVEGVDYVLHFIPTFSDGTIEPVSVKIPVRRYAPPQQS